MELLSRRPMIGIEDFCRDFYDRYVFGPPVGGVVDVAGEWLEFAYTQITQADPSFAKVDRRFFFHEMIALRLELFALACLHEVDPDLGPRQGDFTRRYLQAAGRTTLWDSMERYNRAISRSCVYGYTEHERIRRRAERESRL